MDDILKINHTNFFLLLSSDGKRKLKSKKIKPHKVSLFFNDDLEVGAQISLISNTKWFSQNGDM